MRENKKVLIKEKNWVKKTLRAICDFGFDLMTGKVRSKIPAYRGSARENFFSFI